MTALANTVDTYVSCTSSLQEDQQTNYLAVSPGLTKRRSESTLKALHTELSGLARHSTPAHALAVLRSHTLSYLADLETRLSTIEPALIAECLKAKGEAEVERTRMWARTGLDMLARIRADVAFHLPDVPSLTLKTPTVLMMADFTLPDPQTPDSHLPVDYVPRLSEHLRSLQAHLASAELPQSLAESLAVLKPHASVQELLRLALAPKFVDPLADHSNDGEGEDERAEAAVEIATALRKSANGRHLIDYSDLPSAWQSNPFVTTRYRFIPLSEWHRLLISVFQLHNETLNIQTHFIPLAFWSLTLLPFSPFATPDALHTDIVEFSYNVFTLITLMSSVLWHTMAGCAHSHSVDICAKIDYVGIGWLITASVTTIIYYGFQDCLAVQALWMVCMCCVMIPCTLFPFMGWFSEDKYRHRRIGFFLCVGFSALAPMFHIVYVYGVARALVFLKPVLLPASAYFVGMAFYAIHFPEAFFTRPGQKHWLDRVGGGSHAIWHMFVVVGLMTWRGIIPHMKAGIPS